MYTEHYDIERTLKSIDSFLCTLVKSCREPGGIDSTEAGSCAGTYCTYVHTFSSVCHSSFVGFAFRLMHGTSAYSRNITTRKLGAMDATHPLFHSFVDSLQTRRAGRSVTTLCSMACELREEEAHEIAVEWGRRLVQVADLELGVSAAYRVPAYNCMRVRFEVGNAELVTTPMTRESWRVLRETLAIWRALTCCAGFGGSASVDFWDRVSSALALRLTLDGDICCYPSPSDQSLYASVDDPFRLTFCVSITAIDSDSDELNLATLESGFASYVAMCSGQDEGDKAGAGEEGDDTNRTTVQSSQEFESAWRCIEPHMDASRHAKLSVIPTRMELEAFQYDPCTTFLDSLPAVVDDIMQVVPRATAAGVNSAKYPCLKLQALCFKDWRAGSSIQLEKFAALLRMLSVPVSKLGMCLETIDHHDSHSRFIRGALGMEQLAPNDNASSTDSLLSHSTKHSTSSMPDLIPNAAPTAGLKQLIMMYESLDTRQFVALLSALPYTRSLEALQLASENADTYFDMSATHAAWIGYAIFHPRTQTSSWRRLSLRYWRSRDNGDNDKNGDEDPGVSSMFEQMVVDPLQLLSTTKLAMCTFGRHYLGNQLQSREVESAKRGGGQLALLSLRFDKLQIAHTKKGALVYDKRSHVGDNSPWITLQREMHLEMCDDGGDSACALYCVLLPGYGFGWIRKDDVKNVRDWVVELPLTSPLTWFECDAMFPVRTTQLLLRAIGTNLDTLRVALSPAHSGILDDVAQACPTLRHLRVAHSDGRVSLPLGSLTRFFSWSCSQLQCLSLGWELGTVRAVAMLLGGRGSSADAVARLKKLELRHVDNSDELAAMLEPLEGMLRMNKSLEDFVLVIGFDIAILRNCPLLAYTNEDLTLYGPLRQRLAFLSVVNATARGAPAASLRLLDASMVALILRFAIPRVYRRVSMYTQPF